jgi:serine/threonine protein kinase
MINRTIKNFEIKELIATGGMAAIYKAVQVSLDRVVAVKILHGHLAQDKNFITRFEREAKAAANLKHENIVNIIDYGEAEDVYFIAMEYVEGKSLKDLINSMKFVPHDIALAIAHEISQGLNHAHKKGVVHRDIKPANILISYDGMVKIADFGLAQAQDLTSITITGSIVGTPAYMSPEQAAGKKVDHRTDIFSSGVVIYEMITGVKPFRGENYSSVIHEILTVKPPKPADANPVITREVNDIIEKMLEKDIDKRYQHISEVCEDISSYSRRKNIEISRNSIGEFINKPAEYFEDLAQERKKKHFARGLYFMTMGYKKIDDAINEFSKVLHFDPEHSQAKMHVSELKAKKEKAVQVKEKKAKVPARKNILVPVGIIVGILIVAIVVFAFYKRRQKKLLYPEKMKIFGVANIKSIPGNASIYLDNKNLGLLTPALIDSLSVGKHKIELQKPGYKSYIDKFEVKKGDTISLSALLIKKTTAPAPIYGSINIKSIPSGASVIFDNVNKGLKTPCTIDNIKEGLHKIKIVKKGYEPIETSRNVSSEKTVQVSVTLKQIKEKVIQEKRFSYIKINVNPWAKIYIDNRYIETTPIAKPLKVRSGTHIVKLENPNFKTWQRKIDLSPGKTVTLDVKLEPIEGFLKLTVKPWADIYIDGKFYETTPIANPIKLSAGKHEIKLVNPSFQIFEQQIVIPSNKMLKKYVELEPK